MYNLTTKLTVIILTFIIGVFSVIGWIQYQESQKIRLILPNARWESIFFDGFNGGRTGINHAAKLAGLEELRKMRLEKENIEVRIWRGFSLEPLEGVVIKRSNGQWSALHLKTDNYYDYGKVEVTMMNQPKSGWDSFRKQIIDKEILTLPDSSEINCGDIGNDDSSYVVEINRDKVYRTYRLSNPYSRDKCREANQMQEIGDLIGEEFDSGNEECKRAEWFACTKIRKLH